MATKNKKSNVGEALAIGAGVAAVMAAGYFFLGPKGKANRRAARGWMIKMKGEVVERMEAMEKLTEEEYHNIVDTVARTYVSLGGPEEVARLAKELKSHWKSIASKGKRAVKAKKTVKGAKRSKSRK